MVSKSGHAGFRGVLDTFQLGNQLSLAKMAWSGYENILKNKNIKLHYIVSYITVYNHFAQIS